MADSRPTWTEFYEMKRKAEKFYTEKEFWRNRAQTAEGDLKRCQDALMRLELDRLETAQSDGSGGDDA